MRMKTIAGVALAAFALSGAPLFAQDGFGFGEDSGATDQASGASALGAKVSGEAYASVSAFVFDLESFDELKANDIGDIFSGKISIDANGANGEAHVTFKVEKPETAGDSPVTLGEAFLRGYFGKLDVEAGLRNLTWGKADSQGPLDVVNPLDLTDLTVTDAMERKIPVPMLHASYSLGDFTKLEGVFVPSFEGHGIDYAGRWKPYLLTALETSLPPGVTVQSIVFPDTSSLQFWQGGARLTTTLLSNDFGLQYYFGLLPKPAAMIVPVGMTEVDVNLLYNRYHQIGVDWAADVAGFNARAEIAANLTEDMAGTDPAVYNSSIAWSLGFDRDLFAGINLNLQGAGTVRLAQDGIDDSMVDIERGRAISHTTVTGVVSRKFFKDALELKVTGLWGIEDRDYLVMPALVWTTGDVEVSLSGGFFGGDKAGDLGQYAANGYASLDLTYSFSGAAPPSAKTIDSRARPSSRAGFSA
jgi:hypothetical protein